MWLSGLYQNPVGTHLSEKEIHELGIDGHIRKHEPGNDGRPFLRQLTFLQKIVDRPLDMISL